MRLNEHPRRPVRYRVQHKPYAGVPDSVMQMQRLARDGQIHPEIRRYAEEVIRRVQPKDSLSEVAALYYATCRRIRYTRDPVEAELVHHPALLHRNRAGDCDDQTTYTGALVGAATTGLGAAGLSVGAPAEFVTAGFSSSPPPGQEYTHVFLRVWDPRAGWVIFDPVAGPATAEMLRRVRRSRPYRI